MYIEWQSHNEKNKMKKKQVMKLLMINYCITVFYTDAVLSKVLYGVVLFAHLRVISNER